MLTTVEKFGKITTEDGLKRSYLSHVSRMQLWLWQFWPKPGKCEYGTQLRSTENFTINAYFPHPYSRLNFDSIFSRGNSDGLGNPKPNLERMRRGRSGCCAPRPTTQLPSGIRKEHIGFFMSSSPFLLLCQLLWHTMWPSHTYACYRWIMPCLMSWTSGWAQNLTRVWNPSQIRDHPHKTYGSQTQCKKSPSVIRVKTPQILLKTRGEKRQKQRRRMCHWPSSLQVLNSTKWISQWAGGTTQYH